MKREKQLKKAIKYKFVSENINKIEQSLGRLTERERERMVQNNNIKRLAKDSASVKRKL